ncbi:MAG: 3-phosphoglycerate dehydrogenase [bacterium]|nr:3-phosphoglycerate dehydrogenase [bacterium]
MSKKVLIATQKPFSSDAMEKITEIAGTYGFELLKLESYTDPGELLEAVGDVDGLVVRSDKVTPEVFDAAGNLKIVVRAGAGFDNVDLQSATEHDVVVMNTPGQNSNAVAELVFGLMLNIARKGYTGSAGTELKGKSLGIHAYGNIGLLVNKIATGFGMKVYAYDPFVSRERMEDDGVIPVDSADELYKQCHYISIHLPKMKQTLGLVNHRLMSMMPPNAAIINTARKEVVDEPGLIRIMEERDDFYYAADVAPDCRSQLMEEYRARVFFTAKKMGAQTREANINAGIAAINQINNFLENDDRTFQVNRKN